MKVKFLTATTQIDQDHQRFTMEALKDMESQLKQKRFPITINFQTNVPSIGITKSAKLTSEGLEVTAELFIDLPDKAMYIVPGCEIDLKVFERKQRGIVIIPKTKLKFFGLTDHPSDKYLTTVQTAKE